MQKTQHHHIHPAVPEATRKIVQVDLETLSAAFKLSYLAGIGDHDAAVETLTFIRRTCHGMRKSMRQARPTPQAGIEAGLDLIIAAADEALRRDSSPTFL